VLSKLSTGETADLLGNSVRIHAPQFSALGRRNDETVKQLRKALSRKALKSLEEPALALAGATLVDLDLEGMLEALAFSGDRAGLLMCGDIFIGLSLVLREDPNFAATKVDTAEPLLQAVKQREDLKDLLAFAVSDDFFRLRQRLGLSLG
jgi:hypothetical protein